MKKSKMLLFFVITLQVHASVNSTELFPFSDVKLGMQVIDLITKYPTEKYSLNKQVCDFQNLKNTILFYKIENNIFWDTLGIYIKNDKVESFFYTHVNNNLVKQNFDVSEYNNITNNIIPLFQQIRQQFGNKYEKKVVYGEITKKRSAMYLWENKNEVMSFTHSPFSKDMNDDQFEYIFAKATKIENLAGIYDRITTNSLPEDNLLWLDVMEDEININQTSRSHTLVYVWILLVVCFIPILYFTRKIILKK